MNSNHYKQEIEKIDREIARQKRIGVKMNDFPTSDFCEAYEVHCDDWRSGRCNCHDAGDCPCSGGETGENAREYFEMEIEP